MVETRTVYTKLDAILRGIAQRSAAVGIPAGIYTGSTALSAGPINWGYSFMPIASDYSLLSTATRAVLDRSHATTRYGSAQSSAD